ncbi:MAG: helix-turn-helix transcriptional regulator [Planctomycetes bacterium]|nr:helix-turn-helix transcriptional regulator [Planctomycetota bacterium]
MDGRDIRQLPLKDLPELEIVGNTEIQKPLPALEIPFVDGCVNIYFGYKGSKQMQAEGGVYHLNGGEFFVTPPGVTHSTGPMPISKCAHYWLRLNVADLSHDFLGNPAFNDMRERLASLPIVHGKFSEVSFHCLRSIYDLATQEASPTRDIELRLQCSLFVIKLLELIDGQNGKEQQSEDPALKKVLEYLKWHIGENVSVQDMANIAGVSVSAFQQICNKQLGMAPAEYFTRQKMEEAKRLLLETDCSVKSISEQLGYANQRYFSTVFSRYHMEPPGRFRQNQLA